MTRVDDERCARALGWEFRGDRVPMWHDRDGAILTLPYLLIGAIPEFTEECEGRMFSYLLEDEIERRNLSEAYGIALFHILCPNRFMDAESRLTFMPLYVSWWFRRATPPQIVSAFLRTIETIA